MFQPEADMQKRLTVIIPYRKRIDNLKTFAHNIRNIDRTQIEFILVVLGDPDEEAVQLCRTAGIRYHYEDDTTLFRIGKAHNIGAALSEADFILKMDVDLLAPPGVYEGLVKHIQTAMTRQTDYLVIGCYFAGKTFSEQYLSADVTQEHLEMLKTNTAYREKMQLQQPEGTMFLMNRKFYLGFGGCSEEFSGHGWEDYQVIYYAEKLRNPRLSLMDFNPNTVRTRLVLPANKKATSLGFVFIHKWHPPVPQPAYYAGRGGNSTVLHKLLTNFNPHDFPGINE